MNIFEEELIIVVESPNLGGVYSVNGKAGFVTINKSDVGLSNVENVSITGVSGHLQYQIDNLDTNYVTKTNGQFSNRPTVNGTGVLLSGEGDTVTLPNTIVYATGNQTISGEKNFINVTESFLLLSIVNQTVNLPLNSGMNFILPLTTGITGMTFSNVPTNIFSFTLRVDYSGAHAIVWPVGLGGVLWPNNTAPTLTTTVSREDFFSFLTYTSGQEFFGFTAGQNYSGIY